MNNHITQMEDKERHEAAKQALIKCKKKETGKIPVRIDAKTTIFIHPDDNPDDAINRFNQKLLKCEKIEVKRENGTGSIHRTAKSNFKDTAIFKSLNL